MVTLKLGKYFQSVLSSGQQLTKKVKIQIEVKKLMWELKKKISGFRKICSPGKRNKICHRFF